VPPWHRWLSLAKESGTMVRSLFVFQEAWIIPGGIGRRKEKLVIRSSHETRLVCDDTSLTAAALRKTLQVGVGLLSSKASEAPAV
jgi:hypothetical protein